MEPVLRSGDVPRLIGDDSLQIELIEHPYKFEHSSDKELNGRIVDAINFMGGIGESGEKCYQAALDGLSRNAAKVVDIAAREYDSLPQEQYLDRWALVNLIAELKQDGSMAFLDALLSSRIPEEGSKDPHSFTTVGEEVMIRTTAVEAIARIAADGNDKALEMLFNHTRNANFSIKRAAVQAYVACGGEKATERLKETLAKEDHYILDIKRIDVRQAPQAEGGLYLVNREKRELPPIDMPGDHHDKDDGSCGHCKS